MAEESTGLDLAPSVHAVDTVTASEERQKLRRSVGRMDTAFLMLAAIIVLDTLGAVSSYGAQAFTWLVVMIIFFLVPYGLWAVFLLAAPILIFDLEGFELPSSASEELKNPRRDVPFAVLRSGIGTVLFYGVPILAILLVLRPAQLSASAVSSTRCRPSSSSTAATRPRRAPC